MKTYLKTIKGSLPFSQQSVDISFNNKLLVVTGKTGAGKSQFLRYVHDRIESASSARELKALPRLLAHLESIRAIERNHIKDTPDYHDWFQRLKDIESQLDKITLELSLDIAKKNGPHPSAKNARFLRLYEAGRIADILEPKSGDTLLDGVDSHYGNPFFDQSKYFERYLIARMQRRLRCDLDDPAEAAQIKQWFAELECHLKVLLGDDSTSLHYDNNKPAFYVRQKQREPFRLQELSRGNLAFFAVYADLLVRASYAALSADELKGIVLIDEIDAHLDLSLQRVVLPFLIQQFPQLQFIVSTNSPIVLMSIGEAVVYDLDRNLTLERDFSLYSYEAIAEEVFRTSIRSQLRSSVKVRY